MSFEEVECFRDILCEDKLDVIETCSCCKKGQLNDMSTESDIQPKIQTYMTCCNWQFVVRLLLLM